MSKRLSTFTLAIVALLAVSSSASAQTKLTAKSLQPQPVGTAVETDRIRDGLTGPVRRVRTEIVKLSMIDGKLLEGKRSLLEVVSYDVDGNKTDNQYFPQPGATLTGKEVYKYDEKGNISEMTLLNEDGTLLSKEIYHYSYDFAGNWNRMTTSVAVVEGGRVVFEANEVTYRSIMYYLDENMFKMVQAGVPSAEASAPASSKTSSNQPQNNQKLAAAIPPANVASEALSKASSAEVRNDPSSSGLGGPLVLMDAEPPAPSPKPIRKPISGGVLNGIALSLPSPVYPESARRMRASGLVSVEVVVDELGKVISATATSGPSVLRDTSVQAALRARFTSTKLSGQPVKVAGVIHYKFSLTQ
jgi:TonB family protein